MIMSKMLVSVVCTNYNKGDWIRDAIESFLQQKTSFEFEILLIDDASIDHSIDIIKDYAKRYPTKIRAFYNKKNLGITKTWIKVCKEAKGKYIARCDGDDYWIDEKKLQKQVDALERNKKSKWCSTDYNIISPEGRVIHESAFESGLVVRSTSYVEMLATKGFTMASTWLVDGALMKEINAQLDTSAVDDTFNIQLDLFRKTQLTYLPEATVVYRINEGSDSRPIEMDKIRSRNEKLLKTQIEYIEKYENADYKNIIKKLLEQSMYFELLAIERLQLINDLLQQATTKDEEIRARDLEIRARDLQIRTLVNSKTFKIGRLVLSPLVLLKSTLVKLKRL